MKDTQEAMQRVLWVMERGSQATGALGICFKSGGGEPACHLFELARFMQKLAPCGHFDGPASEEDGAFLSDMNAGWLSDLELAAIQNPAPTPKR